MLASSLNSSLGGPGHQTLETGMLFWRELTERREDLGS